MMATMVDELDLARAPEVEVLPDHLLDQDPPRDGAVEDLRQGKRGL